MINLKYFSVYYVGMVRRDEDEHPLGFMTPYEKNKQFEKRRETIEGWMFGSFRNPKDEKKRTVTFVKNEARHGFRVIKNVVHGNSPAGSVWRIFDPHGFELEISAKNLEHVIQNSSIINGEIEKPCMWGREGPNNFLTIEGSDEYKKLVEYRQGLSVSVKNLKPGNTILLKNGTEVQYLGKFKLCKKASKEPANWSDFHFVQTDPKYSITYYRTLNVASIKDSAVISEADALAYIQSRISQRPGLSAASGGYERELRVEKKTTDSKLVLRKIANMSTWKGYERRLVQLNDGRYISLSRESYDAYLKHDENPNKDRFGDSFDNRGMEILDEGKLAFGSIGYYTERVSANTMYKTVNSNLDVYDVIMQFDDGVEINLLKRS